MQIPEFVLEARQRAIDAGCHPYPLPYKVCSVKTKGKTYFDFSFEHDNMPEAHGNTVYDQIGRDMNNLPAVIYTVGIGENRVTGFFLKESNAEKVRDSLNARHFNVMANSKDPKNPVRI